MKTKRGISPIIATVLLILFTVILATVVIMWGSTFSKNVTEDASTSMDMQLECVNNVDVTILNACWKDRDTVYLTLQNNRDKEISSLKVRLYKGMEEINSDITLPSLSSFDTYTKDAKWDGFADKINMIEVIPLINVNGKVGGCPTNKEKFGETSAKPIKAC